MADFTYHELKHTRVADLREMAAKIDPPIQGYSQLTKDQLVAAVAERLHIDAHEHHESKIDKAPLKAQLRELKRTRDSALSEQDHDKLKEVRRRMHRIKRTIKKSQVA